MDKKLNPKDVKKGCAYIIGIVILLLFVFFITCENKPKKQLTKEELRIEKINKLLYHNKRNSVNIKLMQLVQRDLNDPNSMDNIEVSFVDKDSIIIVKQKFTAKNALGGTIRSEVIVSVDTLGNIIDILKWID